MLLYSEKKWLHYTKKLIIWQIGISKEYLGISSYLSSVSTPNLFQKAVILDTKPIQPKNSKEKEAFMGCKDIKRICWCYNYYQVYSGLRNKLDHWWVTSFSFSYWEVAYQSYY